MAVRRVHIASDPRLPLQAVTNKLAPVNDHPFL